MTDEKSKKGGFTIDNKTGKPPNYGQGNKPSPAGKPGKATPKGSRKPSRGKRSN